MDFILGVHSLVRWLAVIIAVIAVVRAVLVMTGRTPSSGMDRGLMSGYTGLLDLNVLVGLILIIGLGFTLPRIEHLAINLIGVAVAHVLAQRARKIGDAPFKARTNLLGVVTSIAIIAVGVALVGGWAR